VQIQNPKSEIQNRLSYVLIEVLVAAAILAILVAGVLTVFERAMTSTRQLYEAEVAASAAQSAIEGLRAMPFERLPSGKDVSLPVDEDVANALNAPRCLATIEDYAPGQLGLKKVTVALRWRSRVKYDREEHEVALTTLVARR